MKINNTESTNSIQIPTINHNQINHIHINMTLCDSNNCIKTKSSKSIS